MKDYNELPDDEVALRVNAARKRAEEQLLNVGVPVSRHLKFNYEDEVGYDDSYCCDDCQGQAVYFLKG